MKFVNAFASIVCLTGAEAARTTSTTRRTTVSTSTTTVAPTTSTTTTTTTARTTPRVYEVVMGPKFVFGIGQFHSRRTLPEGARAACPTDRNYCIDSRKSDELTCMYPAPLTLKVCMDESCQRAPSNAEIFRVHGEDSYCKDYQTTPEGRVCHWTQDVFCTCSKFNIVYVDAKAVAAADPIPVGWRVTRPCVYPDNYKAANLREDNGPGPTMQPAPRVGGQQPRMGNSDATDSVSAGSVLFLAVLAALMH